MKMSFFAPKRLILALFGAKSQNFAKMKKGYLILPGIPFLCIFIDLFFYSFHVFAGFCIHPYQFSFIYK